MAKTKEQKSDDLEIISIGKLYAGPWDKKYWSSSRGKNRYPFPVGYESVRTQNGVTYKMEILEGLKGPLFMISSTEGNSCSGDTPEIAWEIFQKKGCSRIKLWRGKRFSCKIDGVELYGFKNAFVQRLLRELVANVSSTEQSLLTSNSPSIALGTVNKRPYIESDAVSVQHPVKVTGKRCRKDNCVTYKRCNESHSKQNELDKGTEIPSEVECIKRGQSISDGGSDPSTLTAATANLVSELCIPGAAGPLNVSPMVESTKWLSKDDRALQMDISDHRSVESCSSLEEVELIKSTSQIGLDSEHFSKDQKASNEPGIIGAHSSVPKEKSGTDNSHHSIPILDDPGLCAPDTLDCVAESIGASSPNIYVQITCNVTDAISCDISNSDILANDSYPEDESSTPASNTSMEKCSTDSVGQEIMKSMMTLLLPRAVPLLKTGKPLNISTHRYREENDMPTTNNDSIFTSRGLVEQSDSERHEEMAHASYTCHDSFVSTSANTKSVVPDSFDCDDPQDMLPNISNIDKPSSGLNPCALLLISTDEEATNLLGPTAARNHDGKVTCETQTPLAAEIEITASSKRAWNSFHSIDEQPGVFSTKMKSHPESDTLMGGSSTCDGYLEEFEGTSAKTMPIFCPNVAVNRNTKDGSGRTQLHSKLKSNLEGPHERFACYLLPSRILMVQLTVKENDVYICVTCGGLMDQKECTLFAYKAHKHGESESCPSLIGYLPIAFQCSKDAPDGDIPIDNSLVQLTPDAQSIVFINNIKVPLCRKGKFECLCSACTSDCFKKNAVKVVQLNCGYASIVMTLETAENITCFMVCEPNFLIAAEEGGKLRLWVMNATWSAKMDDCYLPALDCMFPCLVELTRVPNSAFLIVGHNGFGDFGLWDIDRCNLMSSFSSPGMLVSRCLPVSIFRWQRIGEQKTSEVIKEVMDATNMWFTGTKENYMSSQSDKDIGVWVLISTVSDPDSQCYYSSEQQVGQEVECWRLALLVNHTVITGSAVDPGAAAVTSSGHGIIGKCDGQVYMWELSTGKKLGNLHSFRGGRPPCIATDADAVAMASGDQLLVYLPS